MIDYKRAYDLLPTVWRRGDMYVAVDSYISRHSEQLDKFPTVDLLSKQVTSSSLGCLSKAWYRVGNNEVLIKGNSNGSLTKSRKPGFEPYSEVLASTLGTLLKFDVVQYYLEDAKQYPDVHTYDCSHVSACIKI